jgi:hypothetical protein
MSECVHFSEQPRALTEEDGKKWERQETKGRKPKDEINGGMTSYKIRFFMLWRCD